MPSGYLHMLCAQRACALAGVTPVEMDVMILGAQGPDPLFLLGMFPLRPSSRPGPLAGKLHKNRTGAFLMALCRRAKAGTDADRAYTLGFLTHYALDSTVHPYVYAQSYTEDGAYSSSRHMSLEKHWDSLWHQRDGHSGTPHTMPAVVQTRDQWPAVAALLAGAIGEVFPEEDASEALLLSALSDAERAVRLTHSPRGVKYAFAGVLERIMGKPGLLTSQMSPAKPSQADITNAERRPWRSPYAPDVERTEGLTELFDMAVRRAGELICAASNYFSDEIEEGALAEIIGNAGYDSGLESNP